MKKKPVKKSGPSTGGKVVSRVNESDSKNKQVPVTSVTPKSTTAKASQKTMTGARKAVLGAATAATGVGGVARVAATKAAARAATPLSTATKKVVDMEREYTRAANKAIKALEKSATPLSASQKRDIVQSYINRAAAQRAKKKAK